MTDRELEMLVTITSEEAYESRYYFTPEYKENELVPFGEQATTEKEEGR